MTQHGNDQEQDRQTPSQDGEKKPTFIEALEALKRMKEHETTKGI